MHRESYAEMKLNIEKYCKDFKQGSYVADIGSQDVNGTYKTLIEPRFAYVGFDRTLGKNVNIVMQGEFYTGLPSDTADILLCGQVLEHCRNPFLLAQEIIRITKTGGVLLIVAPFTWVEHKFPIDCWRFLPDGMRLLFPAEQVKCLDTYITGADCWFIGEKVQGLIP